MANIYESISAIMAECPAIGKDQKNPQQGFKYRGIDDVMNALQHLLAKYKVFATPEVLESSREERVTSRGGTLIYSILKVRYTFYAEDGSSVSATVQGEGMDSSDKGSNKALSSAFKYAMFQVFCIPTEEFVDCESDTPDDSVKKIFCTKCGKEILPITDKTGKTRTAAEVAKLGNGLCVECYKAQQKG